MKNRIIILTLFILISFTWGSTWIAMKLAVNTIPPFFATGMRFLLASPLLIIISYLTNSPLFFPPGKRLFQLVITIFYFSLPFTLMLYGGKYISVLLASIIFSNMPAAILITSFFLLKKKIRFMQIIGLLLSILSLIVLVLKECNLYDFKQFMGLIALISAMISHSLIYVLCKKQSIYVSVLTFNTLPTFISGLLLSLVSWIFEQPVFFNFSISSVLAILYLANVVTFFGIVSYFYLQKQINVFYASIIFLIFPIISIFLEYCSYGYVIPKNEILLILLIIIGILLILIPEKFLNNLLKNK